MLHPLGQNFTMQLSGIPNHPFALPFGTIGFSNQTFSGASLPVGLDAVGAPGCQLFVSMDLDTVLSNSGGFANWPVNIPYDPVFHDLDVYAQGGVLAFGFNPAGFVVSNAVRVHIGWQ